MPIYSSSPTLWTHAFLTEGMSGQFLLFWYFTEIPVFYANSVDSERKPRSAASDLGRNCLPVSLLLDARQKWVKDLASLKRALINSVAQF